LVIVRVVLTTFSSLETNVNKHVIHRSVIVDAGAKTDTVPRPC
jgi:hypothetical protein